MYRGIFISLLMITALFALASQSARADIIEVSGTVCDTTWTYPDTVHVTNNITVSTGCVLHIEAGVVVGVAGSRYIKVDGLLDLQSSAGNEIVFTSSTDILDQDPDAGDWGFLWLANSANDIHDCIFKYGGYYSSYPYVIYAENCSPTIRDNQFYQSYRTSTVIRYNYAATVFNTVTVSNNEIYDSCGTGISIAGNATYMTANVSDNYLYGNDQYGMTVTSRGIYMENVRDVSVISDNVLVNFGYGITTNSCSPQITNDSVYTNSLLEMAPYPYRQEDGAFPIYSGNYVGPDCYHAIVVSGFVEKNGSWSKYQGEVWPYVLEASTFVTVNNGITLEIDSNMVVASNNTTYLKVVGQLSLLSDADNQITFTSFEDAFGFEPATGDWGFLWLANSANDIHDCVFKYGGYYSSYPYVIYAESCSPTIRDNEFSQTYRSSSVIRYLNAATTFNTVTISGNLILDSCAYGIYVKGHATYMTANISDNYLYGDDLYGMAATSRGIHVEDVRSASSITDNVIVNYGYGIATNSCSPAITNDSTYTNAAVGMTGFPYRQEDGAYPTYAGNYVGPDCYDVIVVSGTLEKNGSWSKYQGEIWPYVIENSTSLAVGNGTTLEIDSNMVVAIGNSGYMRIHGQLSLLSDPANRITYTSRTDVLDLGPKSGDWGFLWVSNGTNDIHDCVFNYGGYYSGYPYVIYAENCSPTIRDNEFNHSYTTAQAIRCSNTTAAFNSLTISGNRINDSCSYGIRVHGNSTYMTAHVTDNYLRGNDVYGNAATSRGIHLQDVRDISDITDNVIVNYGYGITTNSCSPPITNDSIYTNALDPMWPFAYRQEDGAFPTYTGNYVGPDVHEAIIVSGTVEYDGTWSKYQGEVWPYVTEDGTAFFINTGITLTVDSNMVVAVGKLSYVKANGLLSLQSDADNPITFTSSTDVFGLGPKSGDWGFLWLTNGANDIHDCVFSYGGNYTGYPYVVFADGCSPTIHANEFNHSYTTAQAIRCSNTTAAFNSLTISGNRINDSCSYGIRVHGNSTYMTAHVTDNYLRGNDVYGNAATSRGIHLQDVRDISDITDNVIVNYGYGITTNSCSPPITNDSIYTNALDPMWPFAYRQEDGAFPTYTGNYVGPDVHEAIIVSGTVEYDGTWSKYQGEIWPYVIESGTALHVDNGITLAIDSNMVVALNSTSYLRVNGQLSLLSDPLNKITFTSAEDVFDLGPAPGDWGFLWITNSANDIHDCIFKYGGLYSSYPYVVYANSCSPTIRDNEFHDSYRTARIVGCLNTTTTHSTLAISNNQINDSCGYGIYVSGNADYLTADVAGNNLIGDTTGTGIFIQNITPESRIDSNSVRLYQTGINANSGTFHYNSIQDNVLYGFQNPATTCLDATLNWWGHDTGPLDEAPEVNECGTFEPNPGLGSSVTDYVIYEPWLMQDTVPRFDITPYTLSFATTVGAPTGPDPKKIFIDCGIDDCTLAWELFEDCGWLEVDKTTGSNPDSIEVSIVDTGLTAGIYTTTIEFVDATCSNSPFEVSVSLFVTPGVDVGEEHTDPNSMVVIPINLQTDEALSGFTIPLIYRTFQYPNVILDSVVVNPDLGIELFRPDDSTITIIVDRDTEPPIMPDSTYNVGSMYFTITEDADYEVITIDTTTITYNEETYSYQYVYSAGPTVVPAFDMGLIFIGDACCIGMRGNVDHSLSEFVDISDLTYFVDWMFGGGPAPICEQEADVNGDCSADISDLTYIVDYIFGGGPAPVECYPDTCTGSVLPMPKAGKSISLERSVKDGLTTFSIASPVDLRGIQLELEGRFPESPIKLLSDEIELVYYEGNGIITMGILDLNGTEIISHGRRDLFQIEGEYEVSLVLVADINHRTLAADIAPAMKPEALPDDFELSQNYPNPFNPVTQIPFALPKASDVKLEVFNITGQKVATLVDGRREAGYYNVEWDGRNKSGQGVASGVYFYRISAETFTQSKKMIMLK